MSIDETSQDEEPTRRAAIVAEPQHGLRLDRVLVDIAPEYSRSHLQCLIEAGLVRVDARVATTAARRVRAGQRIEVELALPPAERPAAPEAMALDIVHEDADVLVVNKPAGLVVHPAAGHWSGTLLNGLLAHHAEAIGLPRAGIVHRLDKDTSGLMVVAKTIPAMVALVRDIAERQVRREYLAMVHGQLPALRLTIEAPIGRDPVSRVRMAVVAGGKPARTDVEVLATGLGVSLVRCRLHTGRTHQIRVHLARQGCPLVGDDLYGGAAALGVRRQALHAHLLAFAHPRTDAAMQFVQPLPEDLRGAWEQVAASAGLGRA